MQVIVNGKPMDVASDTTVRKLVEQHNLKPEKVAVEWNRRLVRGERYDAPLQEGDEVEIVTFVGGG